MKLLPRRHLNLLIHSKEHSSLLPSIVLHPGRFANQFFPLFLPHSLPLKP